MTNEEIYRVTSEVEYDIIDVQRKVLLGSFKTHEGADTFLINNPIYRRLEIKIVPTLTHKDLKNLNNLFICISNIFDMKKMILFDNKILNTMVEDFLSDIENIKSNKTVENYIP